MSRWYTFAPECFHTTEDFFWRDSGIFCRTLQNMGHESKVVLRNPAPSPDAPDVIRGTQEQLESPAWWKSLALDGIIMVAWARHRDTPIVRAIKNSGTPLVICIDGTGACYPLIRLADFLKTYWREERGTHRGLGIRTASFVKHITTMGAKLLLVNTYLRYRHLKYASLVCLQTPTSLEQHNRLCNLFGGRHHPVEFLLTGYPINPVYQYNASVPKEKRIIAIGRWDNLREKRTYILMEICKKIARLHADLEIDIFGRTFPEFHQWHNALEPAVRQRIHLLEFQPPSTILHAMQKAQIGLITSSHESFCMAVFEGLACGTTPVGLDSVDLPGIRWAVSKDHGDMVPKDTIEDYVATLDRALKKWETGVYHPEEIGACWAAQNNVHNILSQILVRTGAKQK
jgi:glycosyltransferase involved in cell wall biosynthesis